MFVSIAFRSAIATCCIDALRPQWRSTENPCKFELRRIAEIISHSFPHCCDAVNSECAHERIDLFGYGIFESVLTVSFLLIANIFRFSVLVLLSHFYGREIAPFARNGHANVAVVFWFSFFLLSFRFPCGLIFGSNFFHFIFMLTCWDHFVFV